MLAGHLAVALGAKAVDKDAPLPLLLGATFGIDILWPVLVLTGVEQVVVDPGNTAYTALDFVSYPWSHSLLMTAVWGVALAGIARWAGLSQRASILSGVVLVSHWVLDFFTHRPDLPLWPGGPKAGLGLWNSIPGTVLVEGFLLLGGAYLFLRVCRRKGIAGWMSIGTLIAISVLVGLSPLFSPPPPSGTAAAAGALTLLLMPLWGIWIERTGACH